jgi:CheY-like chemotaxis protein
MVADKSAGVILIAENDPDDLYLIRRLLAKAGVRNPVVSFRDGDELVSFLRPMTGAPQAGIRPSMVFLDIKMPKRDGFEVLRWIRKQRALKALPVIILSGSDEPRDIKRATELGATRYVVKHPSPEQFAQLLAEYSDR